VRPDCQAVRLQPETIAGTLSRVSALPQHKKQSSQEAYVAKMRSLLPPGLLWQFPRLA